MIRDIISQSAEETRSADGTQVQVPVVVISREVFNDNHEMGQMNVSHGASCVLVELIFP